MYKKLNEKDIIKKAFNYFEAKEGTMSETESSTDYTEMALEPKVFYSMDANLQKMIRSMSFGQVIEVVLIMLIRARLKVFKTQATTKQHKSKIQQIFVDIMNTIKYLKKATMIKQFNNILTTTFGVEFKKNVESENDEVEETEGKDQGDGEE